jgi:hypothetical protein
MPAELIGEIGSYLKKEDLDNVRLVSRDFKYAVDYHYGKIMVADCTIFPTFASIERWLDFFRLHPGWAGLARTVTLVGEGLREHEHGGDWAWERLTDAERVYPTADDWAIINTVMDEFEEYIDKDGGFCYGGDYRIKIGKLPTLEEAQRASGWFPCALEQCGSLRGPPGLPKLADTNIATEELFGCLPNLKDILCRKLLPGEHVPGWNGPELLKGLSFYHAELNTNQIFYGDWRYDTLHNRVTKWVDEYGEEDEELNAGPQAQFIDDVLAARDTGFQADVFY